MIGINFKILVVDQSLIIGFMYLQTYKLLGKLSKLKSLRLEMGGEMEANGLGESLESLSA